MGPPLTRNPQCDQLKINMLVSRDGLMHVDTPDLLDRIQADFDACGIDVQGCGHFKRPVGFSTMEAPTGRGAPDVERGAERNGVRNRFTELFACCRGPSGHREGTKRFLTPLLKPI